MNLFQDDPNETYGYLDYQFTSFRNGRLYQEGTGLPETSTHADYSQYDADGYRTTVVHEYVNETDSTSYNRDGSYTFNHSIDGPGPYEQLVVHTDGSGERDITYYADIFPAQHIDYAAGTFAITPQTPATNLDALLSYRSDDENRTTRLDIANGVGGHTVVQFNYDNGGIPERHLTYDAGGKPIEEDRFDATGNLTYADHINTNGSHTTTTFAPTGYPFEGVQRTAETTYFADGSSISNEYSRVSAGVGTQEKLASTTRVSADGLKLKDFDAADGHHTNTYLGGKLALGELLKADGSKTAIAFQKDVTIADTAGNDTFTAFGHDTFVFAKGGQDKVIGFHAVGELSDTLKLVGVEAQDFSISMTGHDTVIHYDHDASITLTNVKVTDVLDNILFV